ncbi:helix-turn-helix transcriptional regulator [Akkermansiaceae bacterium]|nr:helix-turn-helix transcriptional regulator [Akkermansiaceae bacterium]
MYIISRENRIVRMGGIVHVALPTGETISLFKLAVACQFRLDAVSQRIDLSTRHFRRLFAEEIGICPKQWLKSERMVYARTLLRSGMAIKEVAEHLGFKEQKSFNREFRSCYMLSPSEFRNQETGRVKGMLDPQA